MPCSCNPQRSLVPSNTFWVALPVRSRLMRDWLPWPWIGSIRLSSASPLSSITAWGPYVRFQDNLMSVQIPWSRQHCRGRRWHHTGFQRALPSTPPAWWSTKLRPHVAQLSRWCAMCPHQQIPRWSLRWWWTRWLWRWTMSMRNRRMWRIMIEVVRMYARCQRQQIPLVLLFWPGDHPSALPLPVWPIRCSETLWYLISFTKMSEI